MSSNSRLSLTRNASSSICDRPTVDNQPAQNSQSLSPSAYVVPWKRCSLCSPSSGAAGPFRSPRDFCRHLRDYHCTREGGSFVCSYGMNGVCPSLPVEGVSDRDYEDHVARDHVAGESSVCSQAPATLHSRALHYINFLLAWCYDHESMMYDHEFVIAVVSCLSLRLYQHTLTVKFKAKVTRGAKMPWSFRSRERK